HLAVVERTFERLLVAVGEPPGPVVTVDLWDLERHAERAECLPLRRRHLDQTNGTGIWSAAAGTCSCGWPPTCGHPRSRFPAPASLLPDPRSRVPGLASPPPAPSRSPAPGPQAPSWRGCCVRPGVRCWCSIVPATRALRSASRRRPWLLC